MSQESSGIISKVRVVLQEMYQDLTKSWRGSEMDLYARESIEEALDSIDIIDAWLSEIDDE